MVISKPQPDKDFMAFERMTGGSAKLFKESSKSGSHWAVWEAAGDILGRSTESCSTRLDMVVDPGLSYAVACFLNADGAWHRAATSASVAIRAILQLSVFSDSHTSSIRLRPPFLPESL